MKSLDAREREIALNNHGWLTQFSCRFAESGVMTRVGAHVCTVLKREL